MMEKGSINWYSMSDSAILNQIGEFVLQTRLQQNKTQQQVADAAGVNRSTLRLIEKGNGGTMLSLLQVLRVLDQLPVLNAFKAEQKVSPLQLAKLEQQKRQRARNTNKGSDLPKVDW